MAEITITIASGDETPVVVTVPEDMATEMLQKVEGYASEALMSEEEKLLEISPLYCVGMLARATLADIISGGLEDAGAVRKWAIEAVAIEEGAE